MQVTAIYQVECPFCGTRTSVSAPSDAGEPETSRSVAAFGEQRTVRCSNGHTYWVQFC